MQLQADVLGVPVASTPSSRRRRRSAPRMPRALLSASGGTWWRRCARAGGQTGDGSLRWNADGREGSYRGWQRAVERTLNWIDVGNG